MFSEIKDKYIAKNLKDVFIAMNRFKIYNTRGQWGYSEPVIAKGEKLQLQRFNLFGIKRLI